MNHYYIGVAVHPMTSDKPGRKFLKYGPLCFNDDDISNVELCNSIIDFKNIISGISVSEAMEITNCSSKMNEFSMFLASCRINQCSVHLFKFDGEIEDEWFQMVVEKSDEIKYFNELLQKSKV